MFFSVDQYLDKDVAKYYEKITSVEESSDDVTEWLECYVDVWQMRWIRPNREFRNCLGCNI